LLENVFWVLLSPIAERISSSLSPSYHLTEGKPLHRNGGPPT
jgi:hypothetical protein